MPYKPSMGCEVTTEADPNAIGATIEATGDTVMVTCRMRPFNKKEMGEKRGPCIKLDFAARTVRSPCSARLAQARALVFRLRPVLILSRTCPCSLAGACSLYHFRGLEWHGCEPKILTLLQHAPTHSARPG